MDLFEHRRRARNEPQRQVVVQRVHVEFRNALQTKSWFLDSPVRTTEELEDGGGIYVAGMPIEVDVSRFYAEQKRAVQNPTRTPATGDR